MSNFDLVMESDMGTFAPLGLQFSGNARARVVMREVMNLLQPINTTALEDHGEGTDISMWMDAGVPGGSSSACVCVSLQAAHTHVHTVSESQAG